MWTRTPLKVKKSRLLKLCQSEKKGVSLYVMFYLEDQAWRSGESTRFPPMWPGFDSRTIRGLSLLLVLVFAPRVFLRVVWLSSLHKNQHLLIPMQLGIREPRVCQLQDYCVQPL